MSVHGSDLSVRRHDRLVCDLTAEVSVATQNAAAVRLGRSVLGASGTIAARVVDCSLGGLGILSPVFFPSACRLIVRVPAPRHPGGTLGLRIRIQRVAMADNTPSYYLGGAFEELTKDQESGVAGLIESLKAQGAVPVTEAGRA